MAAGFPRAVGPDKRDDFSFLHVERQAFKRVDGAIIHIDIGYVQHTAPSSAAKIGFNNPLVRTDFLRRTGSDQRTVIQHLNPLTDTHDQRHVVFDEQDAHTEHIPDLPDGFHQLPRFGRVHAGSRLVEQQNFWL